MNIIVTVRTLNEEKNIARFCESYGWADAIIIADGGSIDKTKDIAFKFHNTYVFNFHETIEKNGVISNPRGKHINFLFSIAKQNDADWIIFDDCDCVPTLKLQEHAREILEDAPYPMVFSHRMFIVYDKFWFPAMSIPGQSLWAWKPKGYPQISAKEDNPLVFEMDIPLMPLLRLEHPYSLLHYFYPDDETMRKKMEMYNKTGELGNEMADPKKTYGGMEPLPGWADWR